MDCESYFPKLVRASLDNDQRTIRSIAMRLIRRLKEDNPNVAKEIANALDYNGIGAMASRSIGIDASPLDMETRQSLLLVKEPNLIEKPALSQRVEELISNFIKEREEASKLIAAGLTPPSSLLVYGPPGVGKTYLAEYLSGKLNMKLATLDLASTMSSYLGKTGQNLKSILEYARKEPTLLLIDEFDAIAKKRDDSSDLGELKRIVNVLLKELEDWPSHSIVMAATNHPELLDRAIWRRFDYVIEIQLPDRYQRFEIIARELPLKSEEEFAELIAEISKGFSGADLCKIIDRAKRRSLITSDDFIKVLVKEIILFQDKDNVEFNKRFCRTAKKLTKISIRTLASWLDKSPSTIQYYLKDDGGVSNE